MRHLTRVLAVAAMAILCGAAQAAPWDTLISENWEGEGVGDNLSQLGNWSLAAGAATDGQIILMGSNQRLQLDRNTVETAVRHNTTFDVPDILRIDGTWAVKGGGNSRTTALVVANSADFAQHYTFAAQAYPNHLLVRKDTGSGEVDVKTFDKNFGQDVFVNWVIDIDNSMVGQTTLTVSADGSPLGSFVDTSPPDLGSQFETQLQVRGTGSGLNSKFDDITLLASRELADTVALYDFDGSSAASSDSSAGSHAGSISEGRPGLLDIDAGYGNPPPAIDITYGEIDNGNLAGALAGDYYYSFTVTPDSGTQLTYESFSLEMSKPASAGATITATLFSSIDSADDLFTDAADALGAAQFVGGLSGYNLGTINLIGLLPENITTATEFRVYLDDGGATNNNNFLRLDNLMLNAYVSTVIPEPSTLLIWSLLAGLGIAVGWRRRKR